MNEKNIVLERMIKIEVMEEELEKIISGVKNSEKNILYIRTEEYCWEYLKTRLFGELDRKKIKVEHLKNGIIPTEDCLVYNVDKRMWENY